MKTRVCNLLLSGALVLMLTAGVPSIAIASPAVVSQEPGHQAPESGQSTGTSDGASQPEQPGESGGDTASANAQGDGDTTADPVVPDEEASADADGVAPAEPSIEAPLEESTVPPKAQAELRAVIPPSVQKVMPMAGGTWTEGTNQRLSGDDRYATAVSISKYAYPNGASTVLLANGLDYPDALSAAAFGAKIQAPLLLTDPNTLPTSVSAEIKRLRPSQVIIVGGEAVVSAKIERELGGSVSSVQRVFGSTRYETSAAIARAGWKTSNASFIATGTAYADAMSASAAAGKLGVPVILVPGTSTQVPAFTAQVLSDLGVKDLHVAGGTASVSTTMLQQVSIGGRTSVRYGGADRYETSAKIVNGVYSGSFDTYWASGVNYADALTGAAAAGAQGAPLMLVTPTCVPPSIYDANDRVGNGKTRLLGGAGVLTQEVLLGNECMTQPVGSSTAEWTGAQKMYTRVNEARYFAGVSPGRLYGPDADSPALTWSRGRVNTSAQLNNSLRKEQPWTQYQTVVQTSASGDKASRLVALATGDKNVGSWLVKPSGGMRTVYNIGYAVSGSKATGTIYMGVKLK
ncbi:cell wall-binding repeat-containing protein [Leucobacter sp. 1207-22]|uniref:cell wall-binding repeat-containing protein n=1 Tax=Leucobacter sp. 1207-22 TaxID=2604456 RepID=UPI004062FFBC